ncbi:hypothetical protein [Burkholderia diffusa]|uniref:hypothetical protein n=1 Tax=Burkholderia diffusa TaxID=488732 RepID=UPI0012D87CFC|nr:hypothetical protein [Burkholderia diffusa]
MAATFDNRMSMDETPVDFIIGGVEYKIPRNYLYQMDNWSGGVQREGVSIRVVYPGLKPYSKEAESCILRKIRCRIYEIYMTPANANNSSEKNSEGIIDDPKIKKTIKSGDYGYLTYEVGPSDAKQILYKRKYHNRLKIFDCQPYDIDGKKGGVCHHFARTDSGLVLSYFFEMNDGLRDAAEVDDLISNLIDGFSEKRN